MGPWLCFARPNCQRDRSSGVITLSSTGFVTTLGASTSVGAFFVKAVELRDCIACLWQAEGCPVLNEASVKVVEVTAGVLGLGLLDSLNPFSIAAMALVLTGTRPLALGCTFIVTTFIIYTAAGFATFAGWAAILAKFMPLIPAWMIDSGLALLGVGCLVAAWYMWAKREGSSSKIADLVRTTILGTALYAASSTVSDVPTALPYFAAIHLLAEARLATIGTVTLLVVYNLCYVAPLGMLLAVRLKGGAKVDATFEAIRGGVDWGFKYIVPPLTACLGLYCLWEVGVGIL